MRSLVALPAVVLALALTACGAPEQSAQEPQRTAAATEPAEVEGCEVVPADVATSIGEGAQDGTGMVVTDTAAYRSPNHENVWFVAARFTATGVEDQTGVWATNSLDLAEPGRRTYSVDGEAQAFTTWGHADDLVGISAADPGVDAAQECLDVMAAGS